MLDVPPSNSWDANSVRRLIVILLLGGAVFGGFVAWQINNRIHSGDVCDFAKESYESVMSQPEDDAYMARLEGHVLARYVIACGSEADIEALKDQYYIP